MAGELVTETLDYDGERQVTVYVPPGPPEAVVFAGDGQGISRWGGSLEAAGVPSTMIVGVHGLADEMPRLHEYSPVFDAERFAAHERFLKHPGVGWTSCRQPLRPRSRHALGSRLPNAPLLLTGYGRSCP